MWSTVLLLLSNHVMFRVLFCSRRNARDPGCNGRYLNREYITPNLVNEMYPSSITEGVESDNTGNS